LFNILHCEEPTNLLKNIYDILNDFGRIGIIHWKYEKTQRGTSMEIRPKPEMIIDWVLKAGLSGCMQIEDMYPATTCFKVMNTKKLAF
jgi:hypothetical protein